MSKMVVAKKYELQAQIVVDSLKIYDKDGQKVLKQNNRVIPLEWVEDRNSQNNNELYVIDLEATENLEVLREEKKKIKEEQKKTEKMTVSDLISAINEDKSNTQTKRTRKPNVV